MIRFGYSFEKCDRTPIDPSDGLFIYKVFGNNFAGNAYGHQVMITVNRPMTEDELRSLHNYGLERVQEKTGRFQTHPCGAIKVDDDGCPVVKD